MAKSKSSKPGGKIPPSHQLVIDFYKKCELKDGILASPTLYSQQKSGKILLWVIKLHSSNLTLNAVLNRESVPKAEFWSEYGQVDGKITISEKTIITEGKNIGRSNFTTPLTQALYDARGLYMKKIKSGSVEDKSNLISTDESLTLDRLCKISERENPSRVFASAYHSLSFNEEAKEYKNWKYINFPCTIQPKYDGTLMISVYHFCIKAHQVDPKFPGLDTYSRGRETVYGKNHPHIMIELYDILKKHIGLHLVGELWAPGFHLQDISGASRKQKSASEIMLNYNIFDCFKIDKPNLTFVERQKILKSIDFNTTTYLKLVPTEIVKNREELKIQYDKFIAEDLEGAIVRNQDSLYEFGLNKQKRSFTSMKLKPRFDDEYPVVGFTRGERGKEQRAIIWICAENDNGVTKRTGKILPLSERLTFNVTPNMPLEKRERIYTELEKNGELFCEKYYGKPYTISYSILSNENYLPQQGKGIRFRRG